MSDESQGEGWWEASDGKWYPEEEHPDFVDSRPPPPSRKASRAARSKRRRSLVFVVAVISVVATTGAIFVLRSGGADQSVVSATTGSPADITTSTTTSTTAAPSTTTSSTTSTTTLSPIQQWAVDGHGATWGDFVDYVTEFDNVIAGREGDPQSAMAILGRFTLGECADDCDAFDFQTFCAIVARGFGMRRSGDLVLAEIAAPPGLSEDISGALTSFGEALDACAGGDFDAMSDAENAFKRSSSRVIAALTLEGL